MLLDAILEDEIHACSRADWGSAQVVSREDDDVLDHSVLDVLEQPCILPDCIRGPLEPFLVCRGLRRCQDLHKPVTTKAHARAHVVGASQVAIERCGVELRENVDFGDAGVDAVGHGYIDQPVSPADWHSWLCPGFRKGIEPRPSTATQDDSCRAGICSVDWSTVPLWGCVHRAIKHIQWF